MKLAFEWDSLLPSISKTFSILTDKAKISIGDIYYDEAKGSVEIPMQRREIVGLRKSLWGKIKPVYGQSAIKSLLTIRKVEKMDIKVDDRLVTECNSCFTALFGLKMEINEMYLGSAEETQGQILCQIFIKVKGISIEFSDEVKK